MTFTIQKAITAHQAGEYHNAIALYKQHLVQHPADTSALNNLGAALIVIDNENAAIDYLLQSYAINALQQATLSNLVAAYSKKTNHAEKIIHYGNQLLAINTNLPALVCVVAAAYQRLNQFDQAKSHFAHYYNVHPTDINIANNYAYLLQSQGEHTAAHSIYSKLRHDHSNLDSEVLFNIANSYKAVEVYVEAIALYEQILEQADISALTSMNVRVNMANCLTSAKQHRHANDIFVSLRTDYPDNTVIIRNQLANFNQQHNLSDALEPLEALQRLNCINHDELVLLGQCYAHINDLVKLQQLHDNHPNETTIGLTLASSLTKLTHIDQAHQLYEKLYSQAPTDTTVLHRYAVFLKDQSLLAKAKELFEKLLALDAMHFWGLSDYAHLLFKLGKFDQSLVSINKALEINPDEVSTLNRKVLLLPNLERHDEAIALGHSIADGVYAKSPQIISSLAYAYHCKQDLPNALQYYGKAAELEPNNAEHRFNQSLVMIQMGEFSAGYAQYNERLRIPSFSSLLRFTTPIWDGRINLSNKTIVLHPEQGLGDTIQMLRFCPVLQMLGAKVIAIVPTAVKPLMAQLAEPPFMVLDTTEAIPEHDYNCPWMSLPGLLHCNEHNLPNQPYILAKPDLVANWKEKLGNTTCKRIGIVWSGSPSHQNNFRRSIDLRVFKQLLDNPSVEWHSLQKEYSESDKALMPSHNIVDHSHALTDFNQTAALMANLDLIISVDTSVVHLAGAMGLPIWVMLPSKIDYRWMEGRSDSPWYPSVRLFRQAGPKQWQNTIHKVRESLDDWLADQSPRNQSLPETTTKASQSDIDFWTTTAIRKHQTGDLADAEVYYKNILAERPRHTTAASNLGAILIQQQQHAEAARLLESCIAHSPKHIGALTNLCIAYNHLGELPLLVKAAEKIAAVNPLSAELSIMLATTYVKLGQLDQAVAAYTNALKFNPDHPIILNNLGHLHLEREEAELAGECLATGIKLYPDNFDMLFNYANYLKAIGSYKEAIEAYDKVLKEQPNFVDALNNKANTLSTLSQLEDALENIDQALKLNPNSLVTLQNKAAILIQNPSYCQQAINVFDQALALKPDDPEITFNKSMVLLMTGDFVNGWKGYEARRGKSDFQKFLTYSAPLWLGETPIAGKTLLLHPEQGLGDSIQMLRFIPLLQAQGIHIVMQMHAGVIPLIKAMPNCPSIIVEAHQQPPAHDYQCPMMSLPLAYGQLTGTLTEVCANVPYLHANADQEAEWQLRLPATSKAKIGLAWSGSTIHKNDKRRSMALSTLAPLLELDCDFHSIQKEYRPGDQAQLQHNKISDHSAQLHSFADTAALLKNIDLLVSVDTSVAHVAAALGVPVWLILPYNPDFRWLASGSTSAWYPSMRIFRHAYNEPETNLLSQIATELMLAPFNAVKRPTAAIKPTNPASNTQAQVYANAIAHHQRNDLAKAIEIYQSIAHVETPFQSALLSNLGAALLTHGNLALAEQTLTDAASRYPNNKSILNNLLAVYQQQQNTNAQVKTAERLFALDENSVSALIVLAQNPGQAPAISLTYYDKILLLEPNHREALTNSAFVHNQLENHQVALQLLQKAHNLYPDDINVEFYLANTYKLLGQPELAEGLYARILQAHPTHTDTLNNYANILSNNPQNYNKAKTLYQTLIEQTPHSETALFNFAAFEFKHNQIRSAVLSLEQILASNPKHTEATELYYNCCKAENNYTKAITLAEQFYQKTPNEVWLKELYHCAHKIGELEKARELAAQILKLPCDSFVEHCNHAALLIQQQDYQAAEEYLYKLEKMPIESADDFNHLAMVYQGMQKHKEAIFYFEKVLSLEPNNHSVEFNCAFSYLSIGELATGNQLFESRRHKQEFSHVHFYDAPLWLGEIDIRGKTLLVHDEQGVGDMMQMARYFPILQQAMGINIIVSVPAVLVTLFQHMPCKPQVYVKGMDLPSYDYQIPMMSLTLACKHTLDNLPAPQTYLYAPASHIAHWQAQLGSTHKKRIGLVWSGAAGHGNDFRRSMALSELDSIFNKPHFEFHSLMRDYRERDQVLLQSSPIQDHCQQLNDFCQTAGLIMQMDLVISVDTSVAHLAAALGKPVWLLLAGNSDYRWLMNTNHSVWYPSMRLFRQPKGQWGDWQSVISQVAKALSQIHH